MSMNFSRDREPVAGSIVPDFDYAESQFEDRKARLQEIADRSHLFETEDGYKRKVFAHSGYVFFPDVSKRMEFDKLNNLADKAPNLIYALPPSSEIKKLTPWDKEVVEAYAGRYKIHLMPCQEYVPFVIARLHEALESDLEFRNALKNFKVFEGTEDYRKKQKDVFPIIVLYPHPTKENAQIVLDKVLECFKDFDNISTGETPRLNQKITDLVHYAQGDADIKKRYKKHIESLWGEGVADSGGIFESDFIHFKGDYKLKLPDMGTKNK